MKTAKEYVEGPQERPEARENLGRPRLAQPLDYKVFRQ